ncbi:hypothetical protein BABINDRAFT_8241 [Babjeviella inositovora NRRL Y-12698]|uniref:NOT2/NOT3/NOT5 C-terminal domain-containing protein n=1 Tax=Babjeviella inositovora NRRL Y-12698 TaxID=984486 RepID=A0A1E3QQZ4_9ASCO|nr:uncharacterized protein BABINDRAFT_8241 [Babjeviella inositovora NRRL Y-12698]ODQ80070.1 hypothetical protein BABINDRAFT_8241 [Babjeviella inositovora NRRL Y-12698]
MAFKTLQSDIDLCFASVAAEPAAVLRLLDTQLPGESPDLDLALKTGIQNLETYRDHIKGWHVGSDVKDRLTAEPRANTDSDILKLLKKSRKTQSKILSRRALSYDLAGTELEPEEPETRSAPATHPVPITHPVPAAKPRLALFRPALSPLMGNSLLKPAAAPAKPVLKWATAAAPPAEVLPEVLAPEVLASPVAVPQAFASPVTSPEVLDTPMAVPAPVAHTFVPYQPPVRAAPYDALRLSAPERALCEDPAMARVPPGIQTFLASFVHSSSLLTSPLDHWTHIPYRSAELPAELAYGFLPKADLIPHQHRWNYARGQATNTRLTQFATAPRALEDLVALFYGYYYAVAPVERRVAADCLVQANWTLNNNHTWFQRIGQAQTMPGFEVGNYRMFDVASWNVVERLHFKLEYPKA